MVRCPCHEKRQMTTLYLQQTPAILHHKVCKKYYHSPMLPIQNYLIHRMQTPTISFFSW